MHKIFKNKAQRCSTPLSAPYSSFIPNLDFIIWKYLIYLWFPHNLFKILTHQFLLFECKFVWFLLHNWNCQLLGIVLNYSGWLLVVLGGWKEKHQKNWFKSKKSDLNQINLIFLGIFLRKYTKIANPDYGACEKGQSTSSIILVCLLKPNVWISSGENWVSSGPQSRCIWGM